MGAIKFDLDFEQWPNQDVFDFEEATGLVFFAEAEKAIGADGTVSLRLLTAKFLMGVVWITNRRDEPSLTWEQTLERWRYMQVLEAIGEAWAAEDSPLAVPAPNRATRRKSKPRRPPSPPTSPASPSPTTSA